MLQKTFKKFTSDGELRPKGEQSSIREYVLNNPIFAKNYNDKANLKFYLEHKKSILSSSSGTSTY